MLLCALWLSLLDAHLTFDVLRSQKPGGGCKLKAAFTFSAFDELRVDLSVKYKLKFGLRPGKFVVFIAGL